MHNVFQMLEAMCRLCCIEQQLVPQHSSMLDIRVVV
jgi:hypothetical protein